MDGEYQRFSMYCNSVEATFALFGDTDGQQLSVGGLGANQEGECVRLIEVFYHTYHYENVLNCHI